MSGFSTGTTDHLIRSNLWSNQLKDVLLDQLMGTRYVSMITDFPDGDTINIPSVGQMEALDYHEGDAVRYTNMDTGNFTFTISKYKSSATYVTNKMLQDSYYMARVQAMFVPKMRRAIEAVIEADMLATGPNGQTSGNVNAINGANHRMIGSGTNETIAIEDFANALYALKKANVPAENLVAIVDPTVEIKINKEPAIINLSNPNPRWGSIAETGIATGMRFIRNIMGFDVYTSQNLKVNTASETISGVTASAGVNNCFFSASSDVLPLVGLMRQPPRVDSEYNKDKQREEYVTTCRYDFALYRPENFVVVVTDTDQAYA